MDRKTLPSPGEDLGLFLLRLFLLAILGLGATTLGLPAHGSPGGPARDMRP